MLWGVKITGVLSFSNYRCNFFSTWPIRAVEFIRVTDIRGFGEKPLALAEMNTKLPSFKNEEYNSESASIINGGLTPLAKPPLLCQTLVKVAVMEFAEVICTCYFKRLLVF